VYVSSFGITVDARFFCCITEFELQFGFSLLVLHSWSEEVVFMFSNCFGSGVILVDIVICEIQILKYDYEEACSDADHVYRLCAFMLCLGFRRFAVVRVNHVVKR